MVDRRKEAEDLTSDEAAGDTGAALLVGSAMRAIRKLRRLRTVEVARSMGMATRSYEHLEAGSGKVTYERIVAFAQATNSDPIALLLSQAGGGPDFACRCADNKMMTIMMIAMMELDEDLGNDVTYLSAQTLVGGFTRLSRDLARHVRERETFTEQWLKQGTDRLVPTAPASIGRKNLRPSKI